MYLYDPHPSCSSTKACRVSTLMPACRNPPDNAGCGFRVHLLEELSFTRASSYAPANQARSSCNLVNADISLRDSFLEQAFTWMVHQLACTLMAGRCKSRYSKASSAWQQEWHPVAPPPEAPTYKHTLLSRANSQCVDFLKLPLPVLTGSFQPHYCSYSVNTFFKRGEARACSQTSNRLLRLPAKVAE